MFSKGMWKNVNWNSAVTVHHGSVTKGMRRIRWTRESLLIGPWNSGKEGRMILSNGWNFINWISEINFSANRYNFECSIGKFLINSMWFRTCKDISLLYIFWSRDTQHESSLSCPINGRGTRIFLPKNRRKFAKFLATNTSLINSVSVLKLICFFISTGILQ